MKMRKTWILVTASGLILAGLLGCERSPAPEGEMEDISGAATQETDQPRSWAEGSSAAESGSAQPARTPAGQPLQSRSLEPAQTTAIAPIEPAPPPAPRQATLTAGTVLQVRTTNTLSTKAVKTGETFSASLEEPITAGGWVVAPKGSTVLGTIVDSDPGGRVKGRARMTVRLTQLQTADGQQIPIATDLYVTEAASSKTEDAKKVGIGAGIGAAIGAIAGGGSGAAKGAGAGAGAGGGVVLATRGDAAVIPSESVLSFNLTDPVTITERK